MPKYTGNHWIGRRATQAILQVANYKVYSGLSMTLQAQTSQQFSLFDFFTGGTWIGAQ